jgi:hypothetical protein
MIDIPLMKHQSEFCADTTTPYLALIGGFGCGKTHAFCTKTIIMAGLNAGYEGAIAEPTNYLTRTHLIPNMIRTLEELKIPYDFEKSNGIFHLHFREGTTKIYCLSGENYMRLVGYNLAFFGSDETDTSTHEVAQEMWNKAISRVRWGRVRQIYSTSTPEGFKFLHDFFVTKAGDDRRTIHASSYDNPFLDKVYLETMKKNYTEAQWRVWALGQFGNLNNLKVYEGFDRVLNHTDFSIKDVSRSEAVHIGMDFNIEHMAAIVHVIKDNLPVAVDEFVELRDVPAMIKAIREKYPTRPVLVYPDASGKNRNAMGADTAITLLKQAGFKVIVDPSNPAVGDRINSMNAMFLNASGQRRYLVNTRQCPFYTRCLEQQAWVKGEPDKSNNVDHPLDAAGYVIHKLYPLRGRPTLTQH